MVDAPFDVQIQAPTSCVLGEPMFVTVRLRSNLATSERLRLQLTSSKTVMVTGQMSSLMEIGPFGANTVSTAMIPLCCGSTHLPQLRVVWDRHNTVVIDTSLQGSGRTFYVRPS